MKNIMLYFGDVFWCTTPYEGLNLFKFLSSEFNVIPVINHRDIRIKKVWRGNEKFWFDVNVFKNLNCTTIKNEKEMLEVYNKNNCKLIIMPSHMQFKHRFANRNLYLKKSGVKIAFWDTGGGDGLFCDSIKTGWEYFFSKGVAWKSIMHDSSKYPDFCGVPLKEDPKKVFVTGSPSFDHLIGPPKISKEEFCKKYKLKKELPIIAYLPGNPGPDNKYKKSIDQLNSGIKQLQKLNYQICFKTHPGDYISTEKESEYYGVHPRAMRGGYRKPRYEEYPYSSFSCIDAQDGFDLYKICDFAITNLSHVGFELGLINKPIVSYRMREYAGWHMCDNLCEEIYTDTSTVEEFLSVCKERTFINQFSKEKLNKYFFFSETSAAQQIAKKVKEILYDY